MTAIAQTIMGDQNCSIAILARARPDLAVDAAARVLYVQYLLIEQPQSPNLPEFSALAFSGLPKLFVFLLLRKHTKTPLFSLATSSIRSQTLLCSKKKKTSSPSRTTSSTPSKLLQQANYHSSRLLFFLYFKFKWLIQKSPRCRR